MDRIKILVIDCQRTIFLGFLFATAKECLWRHIRHCWIPELLQIISETKSQSVTHGSILSMSKEKLHYFMKIKYFSQLCEQLHVNQFSHNFKENEQIFDQLKLN